MKSVGSQSLNSFTSSPAQNVSPAPRRITTRQSRSTEISFDRGVELSRHLTIERIVAFRTI